MRRVVLRSFGLGLLLLIMISVGGAGPSEAQGQGNLNARLHGEYAFTQSRQCVESTAGFGGPSGLQLLPIPSTGGFISRTVAAVRGRIHYNGDGTGTATGRGTIVNLGVEVGGIPVIESEFVCNLGYTVNPDGSVNEFANCTFEVVAPPPPAGGLPVTGTVTGRESRRQIVQGNTAVLGAPADRPVIETVTITSPPVAFPVRDRICVRSSIATKLSPR